MKPYTHVLCSLMALALASCADEGPFEAGVFESEIKIEQVTATTAVISVIYPETSGQLLNPNPEWQCDIYLLPYGALDNYNNRKGYRHSSTITGSGNTIRTFSFQDLKSDTEYEVFVETPTKVDGENEWGTYYTKKMGSFKTKEPMDYSELGNITCSLGGKCQYPKIQVKLTLPDGIYFYQSGYYHTVEAFSDPEKNDMVGNISVIGRDNENTLSFEMSAGSVDTGKLYFRITGFFIYQPYELFLEDISLESTEPLVIPDDYYI